MFDSADIVLGLVRGEPGFRLRRRDAAKDKKGKDAKKTTSGEAGAATGASVRGSVL